MLCKSWAALRRAHLVNFTSYTDDSIGGDTNHDVANSKPISGDWGGIVFRSYDNQSLNRNFSFPVGANYGLNKYGSGPMVGLNNTNPVSGADDTLSIVNFAQIRYGGGAVPQTVGTRYDGIEMFNSRPAITNDLISNVGKNVAQAAISADMDSLRQDDVAAGVLVRRTTVVNNGLNGIWIRPNLSGVVETTNALPNLQDNPLSLGGAQNYVINSPLPYLLVSRMEVGQSLLNQDPQQVVPVRVRLYVQPGMMIKSQRGAGIEVLDRSVTTADPTPTDPFNQLVTFFPSSINVGDRTYISGFDSQASFAPSTTQGGGFFFGGTTITGLVTSTYGPAALPNPQQQRVQAGNGGRRPGAVHLAVRLQGHDLLRRPDHRSEDDDRAGDRFGQQCHRPSLSALARQRSGPGAVGQPVDRDRCTGHG